MAPLLKNKKQKKKPACCSTSGTGAASYKLAILFLATPPWNTPVFVIEKKSGKWPLLQDLRAVNKTMVLMGALQPGLPSPVTIPLGYFKMIVDLKNCFSLLHYTLRIKNVLPSVCPLLIFKHPCNDINGVFSPSHGKSSHSVSIFYRFSHAICTRLLASNVYNSLHG